jgi:4-hydroxy-4-methyl-2-oxoglutarate aldolase
VHAKYAACIVNQRETNILPDIQHFDRVDRETINRFGTVGAASAHESQARTGALSAAVKPLARGGPLCGPAFTLRLAPGDNLGLHLAVATAQPGDVIVIDAADQVEYGPFGEILALSAQTRGIAGLVTSGSIRDSDKIVALGFKVFCKGVSIKGTRKEAPPEVACPIVIDGIAIHPGDLVLGDADGVVIVPRAAAREVLEMALAREHSEIDAKARVRAGATTWELLGLDQALQRISS